MTLQIQAGKYYERRDGTIAGPIRKRDEVCEGATYPWADQIRRTYMDNGRLFSVMEDSTDLIREVPAPQTHSPSSLIFGAATVGREPTPKPAKEPLNLWVTICGVSGRVVGTWREYPPKSYMNAAKVVGNHIIRMREVEES